MTSPLQLVLVSIWAFFFGFAVSKTDNKSNRTFWVWLVVLCALDFAVSFAFALSMQR